MEEIRNILFNSNWSTFKFPQVGANDVLDMLIIAYLIYKVLMWIKDTLAWSLIKGLFIIIIVYFVSLFLQMRTVTWLIINSLNVGLVAVLVLFQPELRKLLTEIGEGKINKFFTASNQEARQQRNEAVAEIVKAAAIFSKERTGALIVMEREVPLGDIENTGIPLDAKCTSQLILNIFIDKTPLHDGALLVRNDRIMAASCILPLTEKEIGRELGTRHRAAVGISEISDASVLVVSEETGCISIAKTGKLSQNLSVEQINEILLEEVGSQNLMQLVGKKKV